MGSAIRQNFLNNNISKKDILVIDPRSNLADITSISNINKDYKADVIIFAIKPQECEDILRELKSLQPYNQNTIFISILAGKKIKVFEDIFGKDKKIIRLMPNLPILIGEGISAYFANKNIKNNEEKAIIDLFGQNLKLSNEDLINQATAISGSGPAYLFLFAKSIIDAAKELGLDEEESKKLTKQTLLGASKMLLKEDNIDQLISNVTSKGGTTQAALDVFDGSLQDLTLKAIKAAFERSKDLSS